MAQSLFLQLRHQWPGLSIDVLAPGFMLPLLERMPEVRAAIEMPLGHGEFGLRRRRQLGRRLRRHHYDWAIVLPNSWKSALVPWFARIPRRTGFRGEQRYGLLNDLRRLERDRLPMTVQRFVALGVDAGQPLPPVHNPQLQLPAAECAAIVQRLGVDAQQRLLALCPGAEYGPAKRWPAAQFAALAQEASGRGWHCVLLGSARDSAVCADIQRRLDSDCVQDLSGRTTLVEALALLQSAAHVVSNDSGLMHLAAAAGAPMTALYGSSDPAFTPPLSTRARVLRLGLDCSPCFQRECPLGTLACLQGLSASAVASAVFGDTAGLPHDAAG